MACLLVAACGDEKDECESTIDCAPGSHCVDGLCGWECAHDYHCGSPDLRCDDRGRCIPIVIDDPDVCDPPRAFCYGVCVPLDGDEANCGACGVRCDPGEACDDGTCVLWSNEGCSPDAVGREAFAATMAGCPGTVSWSDRAELCGAGWFPCTARQWVDRRGGLAPGYHYWTNDDLRYSGDAGACWVDEAIGTACTGEPMRVCASTGSDDLGNDCNWASCGYESAPPPNQYFGGCSGDSTAGTLCCR